MGLFDLTAILIRHGRIRILNGFFITQSKSFCQVTYKCELSNIHHHYTFIFSKLLISDKETHVSCTCCNSELFSVISLYHIEIKQFNQPDNYSIKLTEKFCLKLLNDYFIIDMSSLMRRYKLSFSTILRILKKFISPFLDPFRIYSKSIIKTGISHKKLHKKLHKNVIKLIYDGWDNRLISHRYPSQFPKMTSLILSFWNNFPYPFSNVKNFSYVSINWLHYISKLNNTHIKTIIDGEFTLNIKNRKAKVDGFSKKFNTIFEFHGCFFHKCPNCNYPSPPHFSISYDKTIIRDKNISDLGYSLVSIWECDWIQFIVYNWLLKNNLSVVRPFLNHSRINDTFLDLYLF